MTKSQIPESASVANTIVTTACLFLILAGLRFASPIVVPFILAFFLAMVSLRPLSFLKKKRVPSLVAFFIIIAAVLVMSVVLIFVIEISLGDFLDSLPEFQQNIQEKKTALLSWINRSGISLENKKALDALNPGEAMRLVAHVLGGLSTMFGNAFMILFLVVFLLLERSNLPGKFRQTLRNPDKSIAAIDEFIEKVQHYLTIKTYMSFATGLSVAIWLFIIGADLPLFMGLLAFLLNYIPNIGSILAAVPAVLITLINFGVGKTVLVIIGYIVINTVFGNIVEPRMMGKGLSLSPFVVFLSLIVWGWLFGPVGMLLSVPLTMLLKIACESNDATRWIAVYLGSGSSADHSQDAS